MTEEETVLDYPRRYQEALLGMVRDVLREVAEDGLPGPHFFYLTFDTTAPGVELSEGLRQSHPETMTVVLQNQFWSLQVDDEAFRVTLRFGGAPERLVVPWSALRAFVDPAAEFGLDLGRVDRQSSSAEAPQAADFVEDEGPDSDPAEGEGDGDRAKVVRLRDFKDR